jgi:DNA-directed RNA polymerase subunit H
MAFDVTKHSIVPKHGKLSEKEKRELLEQHNILVAQLPRIFKDDPGISHLDVNEGDVIKISRKSPTSGETFYFRQVVAR